MDKGQRYSEIISHSVNATFGNLLMLESVSMATSLLARSRNIMCDGDWTYDVNCRFNGIQYDSTIMNNAIKVDELKIILLEQF